MRSNYRYYRWLALRQLPLFLTVVFLVGAATLLTARLMPPKYAPVARLLMNATTVSQGPQSAGTDMAAAAHLQNIETRLLTQSRLQNINQQLNAQQTVDQFRDAITTEILSGRGKATVMTVSVSSTDADLATKATNRLANEVLVEHRAIRTERAEDALVFFRREVVSTKLQLDEKYDTLHGFMAANTGKLPKDFVSYQDQRNRLLFRLATKPEPTRKSSTRTRLEAELSEARLALADQHPRIQNLLSKLAALEPDVAELSENAAVTALSNIEALLAQIPMNELALNALKRDHERAQTQYDAAVQRLEMAQINQRIALQTEGNQLTIVEPAMRPDFPEGPRQKIIFAVGGALSLILAGLAALFVARSDTKLRRPNDLQIRLGLTPYAVIPRMQPA